MPIASESEVSAPALIAHHKPPLREVVEHCGVHRNHHRVHLCQIGGAGRELDGFGVVDQRRLEHHAVGDVLAGICEMFADECIIEAELVGEDDRLAILAQSLRPVPADWVHGHGEVAQPH